jgi:hypothetical protein
MTLAERIEAIEQAYEFMLAYAAQGRRGESEGQGSIREFLDRAMRALDGIAAVATAEAAPRDPAWNDFITVLSGDAATAGAALRLVLAQRDISSQLIDNLNASIHLRALLTDIFLLDEALKQEPGDA